MAEAVGVSKDTVQRVWSARGLKPHRVETFKLSNDPRFDEKLVDVVGLYVNPPEKAIVLCADEKASVQAPDRTQASLPMIPGRAQTMTYDYKGKGPPRYLPPLTCSPARSSDSACPGTVIRSS